MVTSVPHLLRQFLCDLFQARDGQFVRGTQVLLVQLPAVLHIGDPIVAALRASFFASRVLPSFALETKRGNTREPREPGGRVRCKVQVRELTVPASSQ